MIRLGFTAKAVSTRGTVAAILTFCSFVFFLAGTANGLDRGWTEYQSSAFNPPALSPIFQENFNDYTNGIQDHLQPGTGLQLSFNGDVPGWTKAGFHAVHAVNFGGGNYAATFYKDNKLTLNSPIAANNAGAPYTVSFDAGPSVYFVLHQATVAGDGLVIKVLRGDNSVLASHTVLPNAWITGPNAQNLTGYSFGYTGDGTGPVRLEISTVNPTADRFGGAIDNLSVSEGISVAGGDVGGLIAAINAANSSPGADVINLAAGSTYTLTVVNNFLDWQGQNGLPVVTANSNITINGNGAIIERSSAEGTPAFRVFFNLGNLTLKEVTIRGGKSAQTYFGYIGGGGGIKNHGKLQVLSSTITENSGSDQGSSEDGGGIMNQGGTVTVTNSTISNNRAFGGYGGGGILNFGNPGKVTISNSTIYGNRIDHPTLGGRGDAIATAFTEPGSITVKNSILVSQVQLGRTACFETGVQPNTLRPNSLGQNIASDNSCGLNGNGDQIVPNFQLGALADNGGPTPTHTLLAGSPAIDAIPVADCTTADGSSLSTDQRGVARPQGSACDIGAFEATDTTAPVLSLPDNISVEAANLSGMTVNYAASATDDVDGDVAVDCSPASGSVFAFGTTTVNCSSSDQSGNTATGSFTVTVQDTTSPTISNVPANQNVPATSPAGAQVSYTSPTATDTVDGNVSVNCSPSSGSTFAIGTTTVSCTATDNSGNTSSPSTFTVTVFDSANLVVTNTNDSGIGSLRQAMLDANSNADVSTIRFNIPDAGPYTINLQSALPLVTTTMKIDAATQPGYSGNPIVELNGASAGVANGFQVNASNSLIRGFAINRFSVIGIYLTGGNSNVIEGNYLGLDLSGTSVPSFVYTDPQTGQTIQINGNRFNGLRALGANHVIGGTTPSARNVISGNGGVNLLIYASNCRIQGNYIGTNATGTAALGGLSLSLIGGASNNLVGGTTPEARNVISGNRTSGIGINDVDGGGGTGNLIQGNYIGTNAAGNAAIPNGADGIHIFGNVSSNTIGGTMPGAGNVISGNGGAGVVIINSATGIKVQGNFIGLKADGSSALPNTGAGVYIGSSSGNLVGGTESGARNIIAGNNGSGINIHSGSSNNTVQGNFIGTDVSGNTRMANGGNGVYIFDSSDNLVGGATLEARNLISGNNFQGVNIQRNSSRNKVQGNYIGVNVSGNAAIPNNNSGIIIFDGATENLVGGTDQGAGNLISGGNSQGIYIGGTGTPGSSGTGTGTARNVVQGNLIGTNADGTVALGNLSGILVNNSPNNIIGGAGSAGRNVLSGNRQFGVFMIGAESVGNSIRGNFIGTNIAGDAKVTNALGGILINAGGNNTIGGTSSEDRNIVSGNQNAGITIQSNASGNLVQGNFVGVGVGGVSLGNQTYGIIVNTASNNTIGGATAEAGNVVAFNLFGISIRNGNGNSILSNSIYSNISLGITLESNGNNNQTAPVIASALVNDGNSADLVGQLTGAPNSAFNIQFFTNESCDSSGSGEGQNLIGTTTVTSDSNGLASFSFTGAAQLGQIITATATSSNGNTSRFSQCKEVTRAVPTIEWNTPVDITYGTPLGVDQLNAAASFNGAAVEGTFTYSPALGTLLNVGDNQTLTVNFTPNDLTRFTETSASVTINVKKANQTITWSNPADIVFGTPLDGTQLNATVSVVGPAVAGAITFSPAAGTILPVGNGQVLTVNVAETPEYNAGSATVVINVLSAQDGIRRLIITVNQMVSNNEISSQTGNPLLAQLNAALHSSVRGDTGATVNQLNAFINRLEAAVSAGQMTPQQAEALISWARVIIRALQM